ncbi:MAG TPA: hypothetical protein VFW11_15485 [Cyclobacteriaceae bacterium]|nr:hypothetical protein [Cyclobacteriaceae bacterium]
MRMLLRVSCDVVASNSAMKDGTLAKIVQDTIEKLKPEASYFLSMNGKRGCYIFFDMKDPSQIPDIAEPYFLNLGAEVEFIPVMNADELGKGLEIAAKHSLAKPSLN